MANIAWPSSLLPSEFLLKRYTKVFRSKSMFDHKGQNTDMLNDRWLASVSISSRDKDVAPTFEAFINNLRNGANTVELYHFSRPTISGTMTGTLTGAAAALGSQTLVVSTPTGQTLKAGDMIGVSGLLLQVAFDCVSVGNLIEIPLTMRLRKAVPIGTTVITSNPTAKFHVPSQTSTSFGPAGRIMGVSFDLLEVIN